MKFVLTKRHYDMEEGSTWFDAGPAVTPDGVGESRVVTKIENDTSEGCLRIVPTDKLKEV
jgi:hypothetical protein